MESSASDEQQQQQATTPILQECQRLRRLQALLSDMWREEVHAYENSPSTEASTVAAGGGHGHGTRNRPNPSGVVENEKLFPYHAALYPLLDCYDSIREDGEYVNRRWSAPQGNGDSSQAQAVVQPSPAPAPHRPNGHRRSRFGQRRVDFRGVPIEELANLVGHLPNSAWAIRRLMPRDRMDRFEELERTMLSDDGGEEGENGPAPFDEEVGGPDNEQHDVAPPPPRQHGNNRFWDVLIDPVAGTTSAAVAFDDMSMPPEEEDHDLPDNIINQWDDVIVDANEDEEEVSDEGWEDVDDDYEENAEMDAPLDGARIARDFTFLRWWQHTIVEERRGAIENGSGASKEKPSRGPCTQDWSPESLFRGCPSATFILLKVLKHALSDLQREFRLARAVVLLMADWCLCNEAEGEQIEGEGIQCLRQILTIVSSEYVQSCGGYCHEWYISQGGISDDEEELDDLEHPVRLDAPNHYCSDWWDFLGSVSTLLSYGITYMSRQHANVICAFVIQEINRASSSAGPIDGNSARSREMPGKAYLKQNIYFANNAEYDDFGRQMEVPQDSVGCQLNINLILSILSALRHHALSDRMRLVKLLETNKSGPIVSKQISKSLNSFQACVDIMVDIGERCLLRLPTNTQGRQLGGMVVRGLVESYTSVPTAVKPLSYLTQRANIGLRSVIDPLRYADAVANSSSNPLQDRSRHPKNMTGGKYGINELIGFQPPQDVQDIVKGLFMRDLVDLQVSGCGYGDFLTWCHLPISPEPLLFDYISNFPNFSVADGEPGNDHWVEDEDGTELDQAYLSARYDFSLLMFLRQWHSPWTPASHHSYSLQYRRAISTLILCANRYGVPPGISILVNSFLPRSWWPDDRRCCWCRDCQLSQLKRHFHSKIASRQNNLANEQDKASSWKIPVTEGKKSPTLVSCPGCQVAMVCCKDHLKYLHQDGHKRYCGLPPFRAPFSDEDNSLCRVVFGEMEEMGSTEKTGEQNEAEQEYENDDDGSWESVGSDDEVEVVQSRSDAIYSFFNERSYKLQRREAPPFANFF